MKLTYFSSVETTARSSAVNPWVPLGPRVLVGSLACRESGLEWLPVCLFGAGLCLCTDWARSLLLLPEE